MLRTFFCFNETEISLIFTFLNFLPMKYTTLPNTDIKVSKICLGTMTWGNQNTEAEGHEQMNYALDQGVNFWDVAELYPVPANPETYGDTERIIGTWFKKTGKRDQVILASKIAGGGDYTAHIRKGGITGSNVIDAIDKSLQRLQTDYIDLYQLHWPNRGVNVFGIRDYPFQYSAKEAEKHFEILEACHSLIKAGKIRHVGLSNETPWGTMHFLHYAETKNLPRVVSIQNPYNLLNRTFEIGLAEIAHREQVGLLAYSPLAFGALSGWFP